MHYSRKHFALYLHVVQIAHDRLNCASNMHMNLHVECMMLEECQNCAFKVHLLSWNCMKNAQSLIKCTWIAGNQTTCKQHAIQKLNLHVECTISFKMHLKCTLFAHYIFVRVSPGNHTFTFNFYEFAVSNSFPEKYVSLLSKKFES